MYLYNIFAWVFEITYLGAKKWELVLFVLLIHFDIVLLLLLCVKMLYSITEKFHLLQAS